MTHHLNQIWTCRVLLWCVYIGVQLCMYVCDVNFRQGQCVKNIHEYFSSFEYVWMLSLLCYIWLQCFDYCKSIFYQISAASLSSAVSLELSRLTYHAEAEIWPHHCGTTWQSTLTAIVSGSEYCTSCVPPTSVYTEQLHLIWQKCVFLSLPALVIVFSILHHLEICWCLGQERQRMDNVVLLSPDLAPGMICHRPACIIDYTRTVPE